MTDYSPGHFNATVMNDFEMRRTGALSSKNLGLADRRGSLGHPEFEDLVIGERRTTSMAAAFLDLTDFTGRTFWDDAQEVVDLAHAVLTGFIEVVSVFGGAPLGLRGDGLFAGFTGDGPVPSILALSACSLALSAIQSEVNRALRLRAMEPLQARAGLDFGLITFIRSGDESHSEVNPLGFAANFAAKCEKKANSWEILIGEGMARLLPDSSIYHQHEDSPKIYQRNYEKRHYRFYRYDWRRTLPYIANTTSQLAGRSAASVSIT